MTGKNTTSLLTLIIFALITTCASASVSTSKSYKIFVNLPASVSITTQEETHPVNSSLKIVQRDITEKAITTADNRNILLRSFVVK